MPKKAFRVLGVAAALGTAAFCALTYTRGHASPAPGSGFSPPAGWVEDESYLGMRTWLGDFEQRQFISVVEDESMKGYRLPSNDQKFIETVRSASDFPNKIARITEWKVEKLERSEIPEGEKIALIGTYLNGKNELIHFEEWKYFLKNGFGQIDYSEANGEKPLDRAKVAEILKRYRPFGTSI